MHNPFKKIADNAKETAKKWKSDREDSLVSSIKCTQCGAPRVVNTNIAHCSYCGFTFMDMDVKIKRTKENE